MLFAYLSSRPRERESTQLDLSFLIKDIHTHTHTRAHTGAAKRNIILAATFRGY